MCVSVWDVEVSYLYNDYKKANFIFSTFGKAFNAATNIEEYLLSAVCLKLHQSFSWSLYKDKT